jgi:hypothetical protein
MERPLKVARNLSGVVARGPVRYLSGLEEEDAPRGVAEREESGDDTRDAAADNRDIGLRVAVERHDGPRAVDLRYPRGVVWCHCGSIVAPTCRREVGHIRNPPCARRAMNDCVSRAVARLW